MSEQENERYARADVQGGFIYNKSEIDYFRQTQAVDVMSNLMLGDFNKKGNYVINQGIIDQLVKVKKVYQYSFGSTTFCQSVNDIGGFGKIDFAIKIRNAQNGVATATLQLLETIDRANGYYQNTNTASIAVYQAKDSNSFIVDMLKYFNVVSKKDEGFLKKDKNEEDVDLIIARKQYEDLLKKGSAERLDALNKNLYEKRIKALGKSVVGKKILAELNGEMYKINGWFLKEGMPGYYRYLNQILDGLIERRSAEVLQDVALTATLRKLSETAAIEMSKFNNILTNTAEKNISKSNDANLQAVVQNTKQVKNERAPEQKAKESKQVDSVEQQKKPEPAKQQNNVKKEEGASPSSFC